jgi:hypothetical protein
MSTLIAEYSSPVKVAQIFADFRHGLPSSGTVYVGAERHRVQVYRTGSGLMGKCPCPGGCAAIPKAIRAVKIMAEVWDRTPLARTQRRVDLDSLWDPAAELEQRKRRPYDGLARIMCEADLAPMDVPCWAYDERGIRRPALEAEIAQDLWHELHRALGRLLGDLMWVQAAHQSPVIRYYRASWEPDRGLTHASFGDDSQSGLGDSQLEGSVV